METKYVLWIVLITIILIIWLIFASKKRKQKQEEINKQIHELEEQYLNKKLFLDLDDYDLLDENLLPTGTERIFLDVSMHRNSIRPTKFLPISIKEIKTNGWSDKFDFDFKINVRDDIFEFEILYCGDIDIIAKSPLLGELYLPKKKYLQFEVGKKLKIKFMEEKYEYDLNLIKPKIV